MQRTWGWILTIAGLIVACVGLWMAVRPILGMYGSALDDPLSPGAHDDGKRIMREMIPGLVIALVGFVMGLVGKLLLGIALFKRMRSASNHR